MGIQGLSKLIADYAPSAVREGEISSYFGRKVAIDASMSIYQFLIAVRQEGSTLVNADGETTSHLMGTFYRTIRLIENGLKPVYVFDGKPPEMKSGELSKRQERREEAQKQLEKAEDAGDMANVDKFSRRLVKVTKQHNEDCKQLLRLMGVPCIDAPCEAEAQCAALVAAGKVFATATEDMDGLTFGSSILLRHLTFSEARKMPIKEFNLEKVLLGLNMDQDKFIDLCILLGCDYCSTIKGVGPKRAVELMKAHGSIEEIVKHIDKKKYGIPEDWMYKEARQLFKAPEVAEPDTLQIKWDVPDEDQLVQFLCEKNAFNEDRVRNGVKKLTKARTGSTQGRLDNFFSVTLVPNAQKRKVEEQKAAQKKGKTKNSGGKFKRPK